MERCWAWVNISTGGLEWHDIVAIAAGAAHSVGLCADGTVVVASDNRSGEGNVSRWRDIVAISAGNSYTVGLRKDGTVLATGSNGDGQCDVSSWKNIVAISAGDRHTVGLRADGTVVAVDIMIPMRAMLITGRISLRFRQAMAIPSVCARMAQWWLRILHLAAVMLPNGAILNAL